MGLLSLPPELLIRILCLLPLRALSSSLLTHSTLHTLIRTSTLLQYHLSTQLHGVHDNALSAHSTHARLAQLRGRERGWARLDYDFERRVRVGHEASGIYDLTGGVYVLGDRGRRGFFFCRLPGREADEVKWESVCLQSDVIDLGLAVYEHDLAAVVTTTPQSSTPPSHLIEIALLKLSTGRAHPHARTPRVFVTESRWARPAVGIEIVGDVLALITTHYQNPFLPEDDFYIFDWKQGTLRMHLRAPNNSYAGLLFLTPALLLVPNNMSNCLEYWDLAPYLTSHTSTSTPTPTPTPTTPRPSLSLSLPPLSQSHTISGITCRCEPNPSAGPMPFSPLPFHAAPEEAIAIFNIRVVGLDGPGLGLGGAGLGGAMAMGMGMGTTFTMFVKRGALVRVWEGRGEVAVGAGLNASESGSAGGGGGESLDSRLVEGGLAPSPTPALPPLPLPPPPTPTIQWESWGPPITRWLNADVLSSRWITKTAGARAVVMVENVGAVVVMDFGGVRGVGGGGGGGGAEEGKGKGRKEGEGGGETKGKGKGKGKEKGKRRERTPGPGTHQHPHPHLNPNPKPKKPKLHLWTETSPLAIVHPAFTARVESGLPYTARMLARAERRYEGVLMDEERVVGLVTDDTGSRIREIVVHHVGPVDDGSDDGSDEEDEESDGSSSSSSSSGSGSGTEEGEKDDESSSMSTDAGAGIVVGAIANTNTNTGVNADVDAEIREREDDDAEGSEDAENLEDVEM